VGDPNQLPATVLSSAALEHGYNTSMFERLQAAGHPVQVNRHVNNSGVTIDNTWLFMFVFVYQHAPLSLVKLCHACALVCLTCKDLQSYPLSLETHIQRLLPVFFWALFL
jgi:hypothetical protein